MFWNVSESVMSSISLARAVPPPVKQRELLHCLDLLGVRPVRSPRAASFVRFKSLRPPRTELSRRCNWFNCTFFSPLSSSSRSSSVRSARSSWASTPSSASASCRAPLAGRACNKQRVQPSVPRARAPNGQEQCRHIQPKSGKNRQEMALLSLIEITHLYAICEHRHHHHCEHNGRLQPRLTTRLRSGKFAIFCTKN